MASRNGSLHPSAPFKAGRVSIQSVLFAQVEQDRPQPLWGPKQILFYLPPTSSCRQGGGHTAICPDPLSLSDDLVFDGT